MNEYEPDYPALINEMVLRQNHALETMVEIMLTTENSPGISVQRVFDYSGGAFFFETEYRLNPDVPFGRIYYLPDLRR